MSAYRLPLVLVLAAACTCLPRPEPSAAQPGDRPNVLWLTCEDMGPHIGPYGDTYATTPHLNRFAERALRYERVWSNAPVCAPARTTLILGMYPPSTGAEHMRSQVPLPSGVRTYPEYLRDAGYYCTNNSKTDYNLATGSVWDESSARAHWKNRKPGQPFFAVFNSTVTHESQIRRRPHTLVHDPAKVRVPAYHPDTPEVRRDWAQYYDNITTMDAEIGVRLREVEEAGLSESTIVFFYSDHGSGMPRNKRWPSNSGLQVPLMIHIPKRFRHLAPGDYREGGATPRLVSFVDLAPTLLSLCGVTPPKTMQGSAFAGPSAGEPRRFLHGFRGRMDERQDLVRSVTDGRYVYLRNYYPHRTQAQHVAYQFETPTTAVWKSLFDADRLKPEQRVFWEQKAPEELYDLRSDPDETRNLAASREHRSALAKLRAEQQRWAAEIRDVGFLPEGELHSRRPGSPYDMAREPGVYPFETVFAAAEAAAGREMDRLDRLAGYVQHSDSAVRFWGAMGYLIRGAEAVRRGEGVLRGALSDASPYVRSTAAEALARYGSPADRTAALNVLAGLADPATAGVYAAIPALTALDELGKDAAPILDRIKAIAGRQESAPARMGTYVPRLAEKILKNLSP